MEEYVCVFGAPMINNRQLFYSQIIGSPSEILEQLMYLFMRAQFTSNELPSTKWIRD